jgi:mannose-6-phosphate isomerase
MKTLIPRLQKQYSQSDPGTLVALLTMNYLTLPPFSAIYIPADGIHAYLAGDIVECMARSNNVLNVGFCPTADRNSIDLFAKTLTFTPHSVDECLLPSEQFGRARQGKTKVYRPPMSEFDMLCVQLKGGENEQWEKFGGPGVLLIQQGSGRMKAGGDNFDVKEGYVYFVGYGNEVSFEAGDDGLTGFMAYAE